MCVNGSRLFLGAFEKLLKTTISFIMSVSLSVRMEQLGPRRTDLIKFDTPVFLNKI